MRWRNSAPAILPDMRQYHDLLKSILADGHAHRDRTGVGTISHFGYQTRFDLRAGFPIVTTKRVPFRWIAEELFWFLSGSTDERDLRARGVDIWQEWADLEHQSRFVRAAASIRSHDSSNRSNVTQTRGVCSSRVGIRASPTRLTCRRVTRFFNSRSNRSVCS